MSAVICGPVRVHAEQQPAEVVGRVGVLPAEIEHAAALQERKPAKGEKKFKLKKSERAEADAEVSPVAVEEKASEAERVVTARRQRMADKASGLAPVQAAAVQSAVQAAVVHARYASGSVSGSSGGRCTYITAATMITSNTATAISVLFITRTPGGQ